MSEKLINNPNLGGASINTLVKLGIAGLAIVGIFGDSYLDILGDRGKTLSMTKAQEIAEVQYQYAFESLSPADKFTRQYGGTSSYDVHTRIGDNGLLKPPILNFNDKKHYFFQFNNGCLGGTSYDINGGTLDFSVDVNGLFSSTSVSASAVNPAAAAFVEIDQINPDIIRVTSGNSNSTNLEFRGVQSGNALVPTDEPTQRILDTYGCEIGLIDSDVHYYRSGYHH